MWSIRTGVITIFAIGLLAGSAVGVASQDEPAEGLAPALTSGSFIHSGDEPLSWEEMPRDGIRTEAWVDAGAVEMSDPRLSGTITLDYDMQRFDTRATDVA